MPSRKENQQLCFGITHKQRDREFDAERKKTKTCDENQQPDRSFLAVDLRYHRVSIGSKPRSFEPTTAQSGVTAM